MFKSMWISNRQCTACITFVMVVLLSGCATNTHQAPIEDRGRVGSGLSTFRMPPGYENAGKPGYYTVKPGDTVLRIALDAGQNWRDIAAWNGLSNPNYIEVGQVLRVEPRAGDVLTPVATPSPSVSTPVTSSASASGVSTPKIESRNIEAKPASVPAKPAMATSAPAPVPTVPTAATAVSPAVSAPPPVVAEPAVEAAKESAEPAWLWPAAAPVVGSFEDGKRKGLLLGGKAGDPVFAAADGRVVYSGAGLRGYGNLIIIKHNSQYLTAYAHNQTLLVKEDQVVRKGQKIAEMGMTDAERVQLHFEIRKQGKPIDPAKSLPPR
jgi:lipoprotein NlpD